MRDDNLRPAEDAIRSVLARWPDDEYYQAHYTAMVSETMIHLYRGEAAAAMKRLDEAKPLLQALLIPKLPFIGDEVRKLRAHAALLLGNDKEVLRMSKALRKNPIAVSQANARLFEAALAIKANDERGCQSLLAEVAALYRESGAMHSAIACDFQLGRLLGGHRGNDMSEAALDWMRGQGVVSPSRMFAFLTPGFPELEGEPGPDLPADT